MNSRQVRLGETWDGILGLLSRLDRSLREDRAAISKNEDAKSGYDLLATDAFLQRFQQVTDLALRKLMPRILAVLDSSDLRHPFGAVFDRLDGYEVLSDVPWWIALNEIRNRLIHEYAMTKDDRSYELTRALDAAERLRDELTRLRGDSELTNRLFHEG